MKTLISRVDFEEFRDFLKANGYRELDPTGDYEILRVQRGCGPLLLAFRSEKRKTTYTLSTNGTALLSRFGAYKEKVKPIDQVLELVATLDMEGWTFGYEGMGRTYIDSNGERIYGNTIGDCIRTMLKRGLEHLKRQDMEVSNENN